MQYRLGNKDLSYNPEGATTDGSSSILINKAIDLTKGRDWGERGYVIEKLFEDSEFQRFKIQTRELLMSLWKSSGLKLPEGFQPDQYHTIAIANEQHLAAVEKTKLLPVSQFPLPIEMIEDRVSEICGTPLAAKNPFDNQTVFHFRIVRPGSGDNNPLHRDVWLKDYANCINLYIPVAGSNSNSSLVIIPGSHYWPENKIQRTVEGALINGVRFNVPAVTAIRGEYQFMRPDPKENEVLVFSPYLIHGGSVNLNANQTRISIELRLWKKA